METLFLPWWKRNCHQYRALLLDIDGTLIKGSHPLPGAAEILSELRSRNFPFRLLTNDGNHSPLQKKKLLARSGVEVGEHEIVSCGMALHLFAQDPYWCRQRFYVVGDLGRPCYAETAGLQISRDFEEMEDCQGIIIGEGDYDWQKQLNGVLNTLIKAPGKSLIVANPDTYWPNGPNGEVGVGAGGKCRFLVSILEEAGKKIEPIYLGKPYPAIFNETLELLARDFALPQIDLEKVLMLGDSLKSDMAGANSMGMQSGLLLTGITDRGMLEKARPEEKPNWVFDALAD